MTYIPIGRGFLYLVAIIDWASRAVLAWRLSNTMDVRFYLAALEEALARFGKPEIFNTDQGSQLPAAFTDMLAAAGVRISMDGRGPAGLTTCLSRGYGAASNTRTSTSRATPTAVRPKPGSPNGWPLQSSEAAPGAGRPGADGGLARRCRRRAQRSGCMDMTLRLVLLARCPHTHSHSNSKPLLSEA